MRTVVGILAGIAVSVATVLGLERINHAIWPPAAAEADTAGQLVAAMPASAQAMVVFGWFFGTLLGGIVGNRISGASWPAWVVAGLGAAGGVATVLTIPHPLGMQLGAVAAPTLGGWLANRLAPARHTAYLTA